MKQPARDDERLNYETRPLPSYSREYGVIFIICIIIALVLLALGLYMQDTLYIAGFMGVVVVSLAYASLRHHIAFCPECHRRLKPVWKTGPLFLCCDACRIKWETRVFAGGD
jgi:hypothetical protein